MTISTDLANFRIDNGIDSGTASGTQLPDTVALRYYNDARDILIDRIIKEKEDYFYNEIRASLVSGQREYTMPKRGDLDGNGDPMDGLIKTKGISIKFKDTDTEFTKLKVETMDGLDKDLLSYSDTTNPFYITSDNSNFLYPTPTENITLGMIIYGIMYPRKLALTDTETLPDQYAKAILLGVAERYFTSAKLTNDALLAGQKFNAEINRVAIALSGRNQGAKQREMPILNF